MGLKNSPIVSFQISVAQITLNLYIQFNIDGILQTLLAKPFQFADFSQLANL